MFLVPYDGGILTIKVQAVFPGCVATRQYPYEVEDTDMLLYVVYTNQEGW